MYIVFTLKLQPEILIEVLTRSVSDQADDRVDRSVVSHTAGCVWNLI